MVRPGHGNALAHSGPHTLTATPDTLSFRHNSQLGDTISVQFDGRPIWATRIDDTGGSLTTVSWPPPLRPYLVGTCRIRISDAAHDVVIAEDDVTFGESTARVAVQDASGRDLVMNKWGRLAGVITADPGLKARLVERTKALCDQLEALGYDVAITSGTLLGLTRDGAMLPTDDDSDLSVILPAESPADLTLLSYRMEDQLVELGHIVVRHSSAHLQVTYLDDAGNIDHYIDIFTGFFRGDEYCQPFHLKTQVPRSSLLPTVHVEWEGVVVPAPPRPADWLEACYGPGWAVPDPAFAFVTPDPTRRRFENWFGNMTNGRVMWEDYYVGVGEPEQLPGHEAHVRAANEALSPSVPLIDLGSGSGAVAAALAADGRTVLATDYSLKAVRLAADALPAGSEARFVNLNDRRRVLELAAELRADTRSWSVSSAFTLHTLIDDGRDNVYRFLRYVLSDGGRAVLSFDTEFHPEIYDFDDPNTWHLPVDRLHDELHAYGMVATVVETGSRTVPGLGEREFAVVIVARQAPSTEENP